MGFMENLESTLKDNNNVAYTENGAVVYATTGKALVDLNFSVSTLRKASEQNIIDMFRKAYTENPVLAMRWLFFARDVRGGLGERRLFRTVMTNMAQTNPMMTIQLLPLIAEFGRWDDVCSLIFADKEVDQAIFKLLHTQLYADTNAMKRGESISLLAKWMPSINTSNRATVAKARRIAIKFGISEKEYRKNLVALRAYINVLETNMQKQKWSSIDYKAVPSRANLKYNKAFLRHDEDRRREFLAKVEKGEAKMHASTLYPHEIFAKYEGLRGKDISLEAMWKSLHNDQNPDSGNTLVVADGSGSMDARVANTTATRWDIAHALAVYFAERASGPYKDKYITFSETPQMVDLSQCTSLYEKFNVAKKYDEVANTNIEAVFDLILGVAVKNKLAQEELSKNILIVSDMEFDHCAVGGQPSGRWGSYSRVDNRLFTVIANRYAAAGYKLPKLIFWRVDGATQSIPVIENELGVALMSGYSTSIVNVLYSENTDPYRILCDVINNTRYDVIEKAVTSCLN